MVVSKKSWHYKLNKMYNGAFLNKPETLCSYFWLTFFSVFLTLIMFLSFVILFWALGYTGGVYLAAIFGISSNIISSLIAIPVGIVVVGCILLVSFSLVFSIKKMQETFSKNDISQNLVVSYIKSRKSKYCPFIEYKD